MGNRRSQLGGALVAAGSAMLAIGLVLVIVKLLMFMAYYAAGIFVLAGVLLLIVGWAMGRRGI